MTKVQILGFGNSRMYKVRYCQGILQQAVLLTENKFFSFCHSVMPYDVRDAFIYVLAEFVR